MSVTNVSESSSYSAPLKETPRTLDAGNNSQGSEAKISTQVLTQTTSAESQKQAEKPGLETGDVVETSTIDNQTIVKQLEAVNEQLSLQSKNLVFEFDDINDPPIVKVVDSESGEIIREIPSKELRKIAQVLNDIADNINGKPGNVSNQFSSGILINAEL
ncbi:flagellar protein FlaG [Alteromonas sp. S015]|uniref:flagellar protein FlaG n=1 Tax=Alteromonas sp. S015 TaxID=3117401 RepID=UPI002FE1667A